MFAKLHRKNLSLGTLILALSAFSNGAIGCGDASTIQTNLAENGSVAAHGAHLNSRAASSRIVANVASMDEQRGVPTFLWASPNRLVLPAPLRTEEWQQLARSYVKDVAQHYGLSNAALETMYVRHTHDTGRGGVIVIFGQRIDGSPVFQTEMKVLMNRTGELVAIGGNLHAKAMQKTRGQTHRFNMSHADVITAALAERYEIQLDATELLDRKDVRGGYRHYDLKSTTKTENLAFEAPARARKVFFPLPDRIVPAYYVEINVRHDDSQNSTLDGYVIAADSGKILKRENLEHDAFNYRVWADETTPHAPLDGPTADVTPHPTGLPDGTLAASVVPILVSMDGFNTNPNGTADPWLAPNATQSQGNNVDAYVTKSGNTTRATTTTANTFDSAYDITMAYGATAEQTSAALTQLFYNMNWNHDYWYDSGFNESAGNAQSSNLGRGGLEGDALLATAQDVSVYGGNSQTPADGASPKLELGVVQWGPFDVKKDGALDNAMAAHEWGHYLHHRLVNFDEFQSRAESEGWGDFNAAMLAIDSGDNIATGTFAFAPTMLAPPDGAYFGWRRFPLSRDMAKNGLTFKHITNGVALPSGPQNSVGGPNIESHNAGEVWATMLFQAYTELLINGSHTFVEAKRRMADYIVAGMLMAPTNPTFTEQRDGILAAAGAADQADALLLAQGFAIRGAGSCAVSPARDTKDGSGVVESFVLTGRLALGSVIADDSIDSCDGDGLLDGLETGKLTIEVRNPGGTALTNTDVDVSTTTAGVSFPKGSKVTIANIPPLGTGKASIDVAMDNGFATVTNAAFTVTMMNATACETTKQAVAVVETNYDIKPMNSTTETAQSATMTWTKWGAPGSEASVQNIWTLDKQADGNNRFYGQDYPLPSDTALESPDLVVSKDQGLTITFSHAFDFEASVDPDLGLTNWDGGLIEITKDGGKTWEDVFTYSNPGYNGKIVQYMGADNPLGGRNGFVQRNAAWPNNDTVTMNFGAVFAGQTVRIRFRQGTDAAGGVPEALGWYIDDVIVSGITNTPFDTVTADPVGCNKNAPVANAGEDQVVDEGAIVMLDASASSDVENDPLGFSWTQSMGMNVSLSDLMTAKPTFTAPQVTADTEFTFNVLVDDGQRTSMDAVKVLVKDKTAREVSETGCGCQVPAANSPGSSVLALLGMTLGFVARRRRNRVSF